MSIDFTGVLKCTFKCAIHITIVTVLNRENSEHEQLNIVLNMNNIPYHNINGQNSDKLLNMNWERRGNESLKL